MADTKALFTQRFDAARTALAVGDELGATAALHLAIAAARSDSSLRPELATALLQLGKLSRKFGAAGESEAEPLLTEALLISERLYGREHRGVAPLLNELSRLHIQRSQHARAEEALKRLLAIARAQGEENADAAIALAGLALVKRKLGDEASAEALYREALRIRENVLESNNMVTVVTLEQLAETCVARGNVAEAVTLLRRALSTREAALGPGHASVHAARSPSPSWNRRPPSRPMRRLLNRRVAPPPVHTNARKRRLSPLPRVSRAMMSRMTRLETGDPQSRRRGTIRPSRRARGERSCIHPLEWPRSRWPAC